MNHFDFDLRPLAWPLDSRALATACGRDPTLGSEGIRALQSLGFATSPADGGDGVGTTISRAGAARCIVDGVSIVTLDGWVLPLGASLTLLNTVIAVPAP
jgi:hypothetical protein